MEVRPIQQKICKDIYIYIHKSNQQTINTTNYPKDKQGLYIYRKHKIQININM